MPDAHLVPERANSKVSRPPAWPRNKSNQTLFSCVVALCPGRGGPRPLHEGRGQALLPFPSVSIWRDRRLRGGIVGRTEVEWSDRLWRGFILLTEVARLHSRVAILALLQKRRNQLKSRWNKFAVRSISSH